MKKLFLITVLTFVLLASFNLKSEAQGLFGFSDPPGCESKDRFFPSLVICGRNPSSGACTQYSQQCTVGDLVETGSRFIVWLITIVLLIVPIIIMYYGFLIMWNQNFDGDVGVVKFAKERLKMIVLYFILMLSAWMIVRTVVDIFQVETDRVNTFLIDENGNTIKARTFNTNQ